MTTITGSEVMEALLMDAQYRLQPEQAMEVLRPYVEVMPEVLADLLDEPATFDSLMSARWRYMNYLLENGYIAKAVDAMPQEQLDFIGLDRDYLSLKMERLLRVAMNGLSQVIGNVPELLSQQGVTEHQVMAGANVGLSPQMYRKYLSGTLTIGDILREQPGVIIKSDN